VNKDAKGRTDANSDCEGIDNETEHIIFLDVCFLKANTTIYSISFVICQLYVELFVVIRAATRDFLGAVDLFS
jgi:hypothetical protein